MKKERKKKARKKAREKLERNEHTPLRYYNILCVILFRKSSSKKYIKLHMFFQTILYVTFMCWVYIINTSTYSLNTGFSCTNVNLKTDVWTIVHAKQLFQIHACDIFSCRCSWVGVIVVVFASVFHLVFHKQGLAHLLFDTYCNKEY